MAVSWMVATVVLGMGQAGTAMSAKKVGTTGLTLSLPTVELKLAEGSSDNNQTYNFSVQGVDVIVTYREAPAGVLTDIEFSSRAAADLLPGAADLKPTFRPVSVSGLQARRFSRGQLASGLYIQAGEKSWRILARVKALTAAKARDAILDSATVALTSPASWRSQQLKNSKVTVSLPNEPDISFGSVPNAYRLSTFTSVTDAAIVTVTEIETVKGQGPDLAKQIAGVDADLGIPTDADIFRKAIQPVKMSGIDGVRIDYEFRLASSEGAFSALLLVRGDETWRVLIARKKADAAGANIADWVLNSIRIAK
ncbi:MAG: hypothetical protein KF784_11925 [Fimbriimonadaceae bacterium]|nr:hypothetical protein [Fimbriimonadaceae bacterium]